MRPLAGPADRTYEEAVAFITELMRLEGQVKEVNQQLDRVEAELQQALNELARERFEECR